MLSRLALQRASTVSWIRPVVAEQCRLFQTDSPKQEEATALKIKEGPERDLVNFPRRLRPMYSPKVHLGFIPDDWCKFFYPKTGVTGPYMFGIGLTTFLLSKEIYVLEHEYYTGISILIMIVYAAKKFGPSIGAFLDKEVDAEAATYKKFYDDSMKQFTDGIKAEEKEQWRSEGQNILFDAKKENVQLQLEAAYRDRLMHAYTEVKKRLDYQVEIISAQKRLQQKHMVNWIVSNVVKSITPQQEKEALQKCIADLKGLAAKA